MEEALALLAQYDMHSSAGMAHHLALANAGGRCVVVEYVDGEMLVTETKVITNHYLADCEKQGVGSVQSHLRFDALAAHTGPADELAVRDLLESVAQKTTRRQQAAMKRPCGALSTARWAAAPTSILPRTTNTATGCCFRRRAAF